MKLFHHLLLVILFTGTAVGEGEKKKPELIVTKDGFPAGHETPEGAACDLARAFIKRDVKLFKTICITPSKSDGEYSQFLTNVASSMEEEAKKKTPSPGGPKKITKVFAARHLSQNGPASWAYAAHNFHDVMFVDIQVELVSGKPSQNRTMVIKKANGKWFVHPAPHTAKIMSAGLNDESKSTKDFSEAYLIKKQEKK